jgi:predicted SAM-dependent methyltransferase
MAIYTESSSSAIQSVHFATEATEAASKSVGGDRVERVNNYIRDNEVVLDVGCNDGAIAEMMRKKTPFVFAADFPEVIAIAKKKFKTLSCLGFDASRKFPIADKSVDAVTASEIIEHIVDDVAFLKECYRVLKPGGKLIISTPNFGFIRDRIWLLKGYYQDNPMHVHLYTFDNIRLKFQAVGFVNLIEEGYHYNLNSNGIWSNFRQHWKMIGRQHALWFLLENILPKTFKAGIVICAHRPKD